MSSRPAYPTIPRWCTFERSFYSQCEYANAIQDVRLQVEFSAPSGRHLLVDGFWDGGLTWRVRFAPDERGRWTYRSRCSDRANGGLHGRVGSFECDEETRQTPFETHGMLVAAPDGSHLTHADGKPYFFFADTAWNGPLQAPYQVWSDYLQARRDQGFTAVLWAATQWTGSPGGDRDGLPAYSGYDKLLIEPRFFQKLDPYVRLVQRCGMFSVPVLLWAAAQNGGEAPAEAGALNTLPEDQAILLGRYIVARWGAFPVIWILAAGGDYAGAGAARWQRIGRAIFSARPHAPVMLHPKCFHLPAAEFAAEPWLDLWSYQSSERTDLAALDWLLAGPPSEIWQQAPARPVINLQPAQERLGGRLNLSQAGAVGGAGGGIVEDAVAGVAEGVRPWLYWSVLVSPPAGMVYSTLDVWHWDGGAAAAPGAAQPGAVPLWQAALRLPGAMQAAQLAGLLAMMEWWRLRPAPFLVVRQPGAFDRSRTILAACSVAGDMALVYIPFDRTITLNLTPLQPSLSAFWFCPRTGARLPAGSPAIVRAAEYTTPTEGDWALVFMDVIAIPARRV